MRGAGFIVSGLKGSTDNQAGDGEITINGAGRHEALMLADVGLDLDKDVWGDIWEGAINI